MSGQAWRTGAPTIRSRILGYMRGVAIDGGIDCHDIAEEFGLSIRNASAVLCQLENDGLLACVDRQRFDGERGPANKIYVLHEELPAYHGDEAAA